MERDTRMQQDEKCGAKVSKGANWGVWYEVALRGGFQRVSSNVGVKC